MKRWGLPIVQLVLALAMLPSAFLFGGLGLLPIIADTLTGRAVEDLASTYGRALALASISVVAAFIICVVSAVLFLRRPTALAIRLGIIGSACYWVYVCSHLEMYWTSAGRQTTLWHTFLQTATNSPDILDYSAWDYPIAVAYALVAYGLYSYQEARFDVLEPR